jgi:nucleoside phosphorylase
MPQVSDFTVGWVCALYKEYIAARCALDEIYEDEDEGGVLKATGDNNKYSQGRVGCHHVVVTCLPAGSIGLVSASTVVASMRSTFPSIRFAFMVGIAGGSPRPTIDVRLGDVIIGTKVIPYRSGKETPYGFKHTVEGFRPPHILLSHVHHMKYRADV